MSARVHVRITAGPLKGRSFTFDQHDTFIFGRDPECHAPLAENDTTASRQHFLLEVNPPAVRVRDLGSLNGTFVNGKVIGKRASGENPEQARGRRFPEVDLKSGDAIAVGASVFVIDVEAPVSCALCRSIISHHAKDAARSPNGAYVCVACKARIVGQATELPPAPAGPQCGRCGKDVGGEIGDGVRGDYICQSCQARCVADPISLVVQAMKAQAAPTIHPTDPNDDDRIPGYAVQKLLGAGGMGAVYLARRERDGVTVAIKVMLARVAVSERMRQMFAREIAITGQLRHTNVVSLEEHGAAGPGFYFVMEYCPRGSVDGLMDAAGGKLDLHEAMTVGLGALEGLAYLHRNAFVHRDLKPQNILVAADGAAKVSDLGLAKAFDASGLSGMTMTGGMAGTVLYMPREQLTNYKYVKPPTDVFSFGATLYHMLAGEGPRDFPPGSDPVQVVLRGASVPIRERAPTIPRPIAEVIDRACAADWRTRYADGEEMLFALRDAVARAR